MQSRAFKGRRSESGAKKVGLEPMAILGERERETEKKVETKALEPEWPWKKKRLGHGRHKEWDCNSMQSQKERL